MTDKTVFVEGLASDNINSLEDSITNIFLKSTDDLNWLSSGDTVLLKPALNSDDPYPSTHIPYRSISYQIYYQIKVPMF